jgi:hypothetical protein
MHRIVLASNGIPSNEGPLGAESIREEFTHRPWHKNVMCEWNGSELILRTDNDYDSNGRALMDEFSDAISACIAGAGEGGVRVVSVTAVSEERA